jgi:2-polyprenyl-6-methoxyphenol hydroxylase-like FAD-dependent oxidoreductase
VRTWGLEVVSRDPAQHSSTVTAVLMPAGQSADQFRRVVLDSFNMALGSGLGKVADKVFRIGHLGDFNDLMLAGTLCGVEMGLAVASVPHTQGGAAAAMPNNDVRPGYRSYNWVWYHPLDEQGLQALCTDASGICYGSAIAPALIRADALAQMLTTAREALAPQCVRVIELTVQPFFQAIFDLDSPRLVHGRVLTLGDAAFVARPHVGMGVTKAALDAECLADAIAQLPDLDAALARYNERQQRFGARVIARARRIGAHLGARATKPPHTWTVEERHQDPVFMTRESGARLRDVPELMELVRAYRGERVAAGAASA